MQLSTRQRRLLNEDPSVLAEEIVADEYGLLHRANEEEWYDCRHPRTNAKAEVKSAFTEVGEKYPARGRFRLRRDQTRSLLSSDAAGVAWYAFVRFDPDAGDVDVRRAKPSTVSGWVRERGGWNRAGHDEFDWQHKLPHSVPF